MLTRRGWFFVAGFGALAVAGRLFAIKELFLLAAASGGVVVASLAYVRLTRFELQATRELHPARVQAGGSSRVELAVRNVSFRTSPLITARDPFDKGRRWARFLLSPLAPGETAHAAYRLPTDERGVFDLGPLQLIFGDPLGVAARSVVAADATKLTVYPRVDTIIPMPRTLGYDPQAGADQPNALGRTGEDFYALRPYELGDDLRRVHWKSSAKVDDLMIRQDEMPWEGRTTVVLDLRRGVHTPASLELAVSAAASIVSAAWRRKGQLRLITTDRVDSGFGNGHAHTEAILEHLASAQLERKGDLTSVLAELRRLGNGGSLAVVTTAAASDADLQAIARLGRRFGGVALALFERSSFDPGATAVDARPRHAPGVTYLVRVTASVPFAEAWDKTLATRRTGAGMHG
ncbi:MAG TPA: DUF58 domain-containing protein [Acidimicrobiales bacterium]|nr:DUF58 domain-containing protein [Acidimicrobiales bacterium]